MTFEKSVGFRRSGKKRAWITKYNVEEHIGQFGLKKKMPLTEWRDEIYKL